MIKKYIILLITANLAFSYQGYDCEISKLSNISSNRALTTLKALGYYTIEHENVYVYDEWTENLQPSEFDLEDAGGIFIIDIPDSQSSSLNSDEDYGESEGFSQYLSGTSMNNSIDSDPIERIIVCYDNENPSLYANFLDILYNQLDISAKQILIEALVIEISSDDLTDTGINTEYLNQQDHLSIQTPSIDGSVTTPLSIIYSEDSFTTTTTDEYGYLTTSQLDDVFQVKLKALINAKSAEILSRPSILVLDGRQARIQIGQQIPITKLPVSSYSGDEILIPDIEYLPVGIVLNIKPRVSNDLKNVTMQVETIITETENFTSNGVLEAPIINNRKVESFVKVADNTPFIIGGLISNKESDNEGKIPLISKIPWLGKLFTWNAKQIIKKEVIVVITPHIIQDNTDNFSRVIPQDAKMFDSFGNKLFPNSYRLKESDIYDLGFITDSNYLDFIKKASKNTIPESNEQKTIIENIINGFIPGEKIITQRMIYDIIEREEYFSSINADKIIFFNHNKNHKVDKLKNYFPIIDDPRRGILIKINPSINDNQNFFRPSMTIEEVVLTEDYNYKDEFKKYWDEQSDLRPMLITNQKNLVRLYEVLILNEVLKLNNTLDISINEFKRGLEIQFPAREIISENSFVIDEKIAEFYYQVNFYYDSFEKKFKDQTLFLSK
ncbi:hypothetical protein OAH62_03355 [Candidatus Marinimicrobia bacterium]|nr:hypothetical protein [Candidatus Neomarinimicrobiota bacterium]